MIGFNTVEELNNYKGKDGEINYVGCDRYRYNLNEKSWKPFSPIMTGLASSISAITRSGSFRTSLNTENSIAETSTDPLLSNFTSNKLMSSLIGKQPGRWYGFCDLYGTVIAPINSEIEAYIASNGFLQFISTTGGDPSAGEYPYSGVGCDLTYNDEGSLQSVKVPVNISTYTGITLTYWSSQALKVCLQSQESGDGADWFYSLPSTAGVHTTVTLLWSQFEQPTWASGTQIRTVPIDRMTNITFQYDTEQSVITFGMSSIYLKGTGAFLPQGITLDSIYGDVCLDEIDAWFDSYYVESSDSRYGRIKWLDDNHSDPLVTVSEGMGYGIKLAVIASGLGDSEKYQKRVDRLLAFWNNNLDANGLMDWKVSGFGHTVVEGGAGSATDADLAMAFALVCAYEKFCDTKYLTTARVIINEIWAHDLYTTSGGKVLLAPGDAWHDYFNPSYFIPAALLTFEIYDTEHDWTTVYTDNLALLLANQTAHACYGLPSDWCSEDGTPVIGSGTIVSFGYEACRVIDNMASGYNIYYKPELLSYLQTIASNSTLLTRILGTTPIPDLSLRITPTVWGTENNSLGLMSILPAFELCSTISQEEIQTLLDSCFALVNERNDYYKQAYKCVILSVMTTKCNRYATNLGAIAEHGYVIDIEPPESSAGAKRIKLIIEDSEEPIKVKNVYTELESEVTRAQDSESSLTISIANEVTRATGIESTLSSSISSEVTRATGVESTLTSSISSEVARAQTAEALALKKASNLSDVASAPTARSNISAVGYESTDTYPITALRAVTVAPTENIIQGTLYIVME
jgi:endo-1,4-beta-D-glucanase Y